jgi:TonB family protein
VKYVVSAVLSVLIAAFCGAHARAAAEFCPASVIGSPTKNDAALYRFRLGAISDRTVSGFVRVQTDKGWFAAPFSGIALRPITKQHNDAGFAFSHNQYLSDDVVVRFPSAVWVQYAYVSQAQTKGETLLDWDKEGSVTCLPTPVSPKTGAAYAALPPLTSTAVSLTAKPIDAPFDAKCADAFGDVQLSKAAPLHIPALFSHDNFTQVPTGTAAVVVAVERDGSVVDAWLWESSGTPMLDQAAMDQARKSAFTPGRAFCRNVPGYFLMRSEFKG